MVSTKKTTTRKGAKEQQTNENEADEEVGRKGSGNDEEFEPKVKRRRVSSAASKIKNKTNKSSLHSSHKDDDRGVSSIKNVAQPTVIDISGIDDDSDEILTCSEDE